MKLFQRAQRSLFGEILDWMLTPLLLLVPVSIGVTWLVAQGIASASFDHSLEHNARILAQVVAAQPRDAPPVLPQELRDMVRGDENDEVYWQVIDGEGDWLAGERDVPSLATDEAAAPGMVFLRDGFMRDKTVRVASVWVDGGRGGHLLVQLAETRVHGRDERAYFRCRDVEVRFLRLSGGNEGIQHAAHDGHQQGLRRRSQARLRRRVRAGAHGPGARLNAAGHGVDDLVGGLLGRGSREIDVDGDAGGHR